jgi:hypothetical protein
LREELNEDQSMVQNAQKSNLVTFLM